MENINREELDKMNFKSLEEIVAFVQQKQQAYNNTKIDIFGFSPLQMMQLLKNPFDAQSVLTINKVEDAVFNKMPYAQNRHCGCAFFF